MAEEEGWEEEALAAVVDNLGEEEEEWIKGSEAAISEVEEDSTMVLI